MIKLVFDEPYNYQFINTDLQKLFKIFDRLIFSNNIKMNAIIREHEKDLEEKKEEEEPKIRNTRNTIEKKWKKKKKDEIKYLH